jgi:hypothetical protein
MDQNDKERVVQVVANGILNSLNINGILEAVKTYSMNMAKERVEVMSDDELNETLEKINNAVAEQEAQQQEAQQQEAQQQEEVTA